MTQESRERGKSWERAIVLKWTNLSSQNEAGNKYFGVTSLGKTMQIRTHGVWLRSDKLLEDFRNLVASPRLSSLLAVQ